LLKVLILIFLNWVIVGGVVWAAQVQQFPEDNSVSNGWTSPQWISFERKDTLINALSQRVVNKSMIKVLDSSARNLSLAISLPGMGISYRLMDDSHKYTSLVVPGSSEFEIGKPDIPIFAEWVLIPNGTSLSVSVDPGQPLVFENIDVPPVQPPKPGFAGAARPQFIKDAITYSTNADYPGIFTEAEPIRNVRGQNCTIMRLYPYQYNPVTRKLSVYENLVAELEFEGGIQPIPKRFKSKQFETMLKRLAVNADAVLSAQRQVNEQVGMEDDLYIAEEEISLHSVGNRMTGGCDYLIVCDPNFEDAADTLARWKRLSGFRTMVVTTLVTGTTADEIESYVDDSQSWPVAPSYLLLLGDAEFIPCFYRFKHPSDADRPNEGGLMQGKIASDRYYGDTNEDGIADIYTGRLPVDTAIEAQIAVDRIINYERRPYPITSSIHKEFYMDFTCVSYFEDNDANGYEDEPAVQTLEDMYEYLSHAGYRGQRIYYHDANVDPTHWIDACVFEDGRRGDPLPAYLRKPNFLWDGNTADITKAINGGAFLVTYFGHGSRLMRSIPRGYWYPGGWVEPDFRGEDVVALTNGQLVPVVLSLCCMSGWFDNETDDEEYAKYEGGSVVRTYPTDANDECFCEHFLLNPNGGAVGVIGFTRIVRTGLIADLVWGWMNAIWPDFIQYHHGTTEGANPLYQMGAVFEYGKYYMLKLDYSAHPGLATATIDMATWFGDPTMEIWTGIPERLNVSHPSSIRVGQPSDVVINVLTGQRYQRYVPNARVTISHPSAMNDYWTGLTNISGNIRFTDLMLSQQDGYNIVVTAHNYVPYEGVIVGEPADLSLIILEDFETNNFSRFPWEHEGNDSWTISSQERYSGIYSAKTGMINHDESSTLVITLDCISGIITFYRKVSSESGYDHLKFYIDGQEKDWWSGEEDWDEVSFPVEAGTRTFQWTYSKDSSVSSGEDAAWIDDITFPIE